jgi:hypothetical protein
LNCDEHIQEITIMKLKVSQFASNVPVKGTTTCVMHLAYVETQIPQPPPFFSDFLCCASCFRLRLLSFRRVLREVRAGAKQTFEQLCGVSDGPEETTERRVCCDRAWFVSDVRESMLEGDIK